MTFTFFPAIPDAGNDPSRDQPDMKTNNQSTFDLVAVDHFGFNVNSIGGRHKQVQLPLSNGSPGTIPIGLIANEGTLYTKTGGTDTQLFYTPDTSGNEYQLTRAITASFALMGTSTNNYNGVGAAYTGGWTFLPGGLMLQYGVMVSPVNNSTITFPVAFTSTAFSITLGAIRSNTDDKMISVKQGSVSSTSFQVILSGSSLPTGIYWQAIGK